MKLEKDFRISVTQSVVISSRLTTTVSIGDILKKFKTHQSALLSYISMPGFLKNTREVHREAQGAAEYFLHFSSAFKNSQVLI